MQDYGGEFDNAGALLRLLVVLSMVEQDPMKWTFVSQCHVVEDLSQYLGVWFTIWWKLIA